MLLLATKTTISFYLITTINNESNQISTFPLNYQNQAQISYIQVTNDGKLLFIAYNNAILEIYNIINRLSIQLLISYQLIHPIKHINISKTCSLFTILTTSELYICSISSAFMEEEEEEEEPQPSVDLHIVQTVYLNDLLINLQLIQQQDHSYSFSTCEIVNNNSLLIQLNNFLLIIYHINPTKEQYKLIDYSQHNSHVSNNNSYISVLTLSNLIFYYYQQEEHHYIQLYQEENDCLINVQLTLLDQQDQILCYTFNHQENLMLIGTQYGWLYIYDIKQHMKRLFSQKICNQNIKNIIYTNEEMIICITTTNVLIFNIDQIKSNPQQFIPSNQSFIDQKYIKYISQFDVKIFENDDLSNQVKKEKKKKRRGK